MKDSSKVYKRILLVDDDSDDRDLFAEAVAFVDPTIDITMKRDGEELMDCLEETPGDFDLIFLDLNMPRKNGKECLVEMRRNQRYKSTPIIIYTTSLNPVDIKETFSQGASSFFRKPNSFEELKETLTMLLHGQLLTQEKTRVNFVVNSAAKIA